MKILFTILHCYKPGSDTIHGSARGNRARRAEAAAIAVTGLHQTFGPQQAHMNNPRRSCNTRLGGEIKVIVCTTGELHALERIPPSLYEHHATQADPLFLGYENHSVLADHVDSFDYFCFLEDDLYLDDPLFFWKLSWFNDKLGQEVLLQPNRYEIAADLSVKKLYLDSRLIDHALSAKFQDRTYRPRVTGKVMGHDVTFERPDNCHSGCFFLNQEQMRHWMRQPFFLDRSKDFVGPIESAGTLGIMKAFQVYKPAAENAGFLEIRHLDRSYLGGIVRPPDDLVLERA